MPAKSKDQSAAFFIRSGTFKAPAGLPRAAQALWRAVMQSTPEDQWRPGDLPLLAMYCRVSVLADEAIGKLEHDGQLDTSGRPSAWVRIASDHAKTLATLASKLRLAPSSRVRAEAHLLQQRPARVKPWEWGDKHDEDSLLA